MADPASLLRELSYSGLQAARHPLGTRKIFFLCHNPTWTAAAAATRLSVSLSRSRSRFSSAEPPASPNNNHQSPIKMRSLVAQEVRCHCMKVRRDAVLQCKIWRGMIHLCTTNTNHAKSANEFATSFTATGRGWWRRISLQFRTSPCRKCGFSSRESTHLSQMRRDRPSQIRL